jgi:hypothetical protein
MTLDFRDWLRVSSASMLMKRGVKLASELQYYMGEKNSERGKRLPFMVSGAALDFSLRVGATPTLRLLDLRASPHWMHRPC